MQRSLTDRATSEAVARFEKLVRNISEDLSVVRDRVQSANVKAAREKAESRPPRLVGRRTEDPQAGVRRPDRDPHDLLADAAGRRGRRGARRSRRNWSRPMASTSGPRRKHRSPQHAPPCSGSRSAPRSSDSLSRSAFAYSLSKPIFAWRCASQNASARRQFHQTDIAVRRRDELGRLLKSLAVMQASLKARRSRISPLMSSKDQTHAEQVSRRQRIEAEIEAFRSTFTAALANTDRMTGDIDRAPRKPFPRSRTPPASSRSRRRPPPAKPRPTFRPWQPPRASSAIPCRRSRRRSTTPPRSCSALPAWRARPTRPSGPRQLDAAYRRGRRLYPQHRRSDQSAGAQRHDRGARAPARPAADLPWSRRKSRRSPPRPPRRPRTFPPRSPRCSRRRSRRSTMSAPSLRSWMTSISFTAAIADAVSQQNAAANEISQEYRARRRRNRSVARSIAGTADRDREHQPFRRPGAGDRARSVGPGRRSARVRRSLPCRTWRPEPACRSGRPPELR